MVFKIWTLYCLISPFYIRHRYLSSTSDLLHRQIRPWSVSTTSRRTALAGHPPASAVQACRDRPPDGCLRNQAPTYLIDYCVPVSDVAGRRRHVRSASRHQLTVPRVRCSTFGRRSFASAGPTVWSSLPNRLRNPTVGSEQFRRTLKTHLFACC